MQPGDALLFLSGTRHAGGANVEPAFLSQLDPAGQQMPNPLARRVVFGYFFARGWLRQEENMMVSIPRSVVLKMDEEMQRLIGYEAAGSHCGFVEFKSPVDVEGGLKGLFERGEDEF